LCATLRATYGRPNRQCCRFVIARLAVLVPKSRVNLTRFRGVFAPNSKHRARVTPAKRGRGGQRAVTADPDESTLAERRASMTWAQRLKRVFGIDIETCSARGGAVRFIACIEDAGVIENIRTHLDAITAEPEASRRPPCRHPGLMPFAVRRSAGRSSVGSNGRDLAIQLEEKGLSYCLYSGRIAPRRPKTRGLLINISDGESSVHLQDTAEIPQFAPN
jgi:hypothetical protein